jgi:hypothetical protein
VVARARPATAAALVSFCSLFSWFTYVSPRIDARIIVLCLYIGLI